MAENNNSETDNNPNNLHLKEVNEQLYKQNLELAIRNKTLSLLRELYQISILTPQPKELAKKASNLILHTLELELVAIYSYPIGESTLQPLGSIISDKLKSASQNAGHDLAFSLISDISQYDFKFLLEPKSQIVNGLIKLWPDLNSEQYQTITTEGHIQSSLAYPLVIESRVIGALFIALNRPYNELSQFEKDSITNIVNVIAVALDRAMLDEQLKVANEKLKDLDRLKSEFVSIAAHQLRSPLTAIKGYSSMILEGSFGPMTNKVKGAVDVVFQSSQKLVLVIEDFLNVTRIELGKMKYEMADIDLKNIINEVVKELGHSMESRDLKLIYEPNADQFPVHGDKGKISQVVGNLIDNAIKYTEKGSIAISLSKEGNKSRLAIKDTGSGISPEVMSKLFQKFSRADDASKVNIKGTGLGLYVAKQIVDAHNGKLWAESEGQGKGSTFFLEL